MYYVKIPILPHVIRTQPGEFLNHTTYFSCYFTNSTWTLLLPKAMSV